jgi:N-glycosylase/DNA lyase
MKTDLEINSEEFKGPLNIPLTVNSGQTSQPAWKKDNKFFKELVLIKDTPCLLGVVHQINTESPVIVQALYSRKISNKLIKLKVSEIFDLNFNLDRFYQFLSEDPKLSPTINFCQGLRLFKAHNPFECIISSISSANCSIIRWTRSIQDIKHKWGQSYQLNSGNFYTFPSPAILSNVPEHDLEEMQRCEDDLPEDFVFENNLQACGVGYRAKYIIQAAQIVQDNVNLEKLAKMKYEDAFHTVLELPGVGPKVADCILLYGFGMGEAFPVDVWIKRIVEHLYFPGEELKPQAVRDFGREEFGDYAGYVQLYLFHYARKSGLLDSLRPNKK